MKLLICLIFILINSISVLAETERLNLAVWLDSDQKIELKSLIEPFSKENFIIQPQSITSTVINTLNFANLQNLTRDEARQLGLALGVDAFIIAKLKLAERANVGATLYGEAYLALSFVTVRNGQLALFDLIETKEPSLDRALQTALKQLNSNAGSYARELCAAYTRQFQADNIPEDELNAIEPPGEDSPQYDLFDPPEFLQRKQPEYTEMARKMAISAVVEVEVVLKKDGSVGSIKIIKWAGYGLDESAIGALQQLKFKPAMLSDKPVNCRAVIRYNFNRKVVN